MKFAKQILQYKDVLPQEQFDEIHKYLSRPMWNLNRSHPEYQSHKVFWGMLLDNEEFFNTTLFGVIKKLTKKNFEIGKILANAQSCLQDGSPHTDSTDPKCKTFMFYVNKHWDYQWGGQTVFFDRYRDDKDEEIIKSNDVYHVYPIPNTAVCFPSNMTHYGLGPSRDFYGIRYTIAYHLREI